MVKTFDIIPCNPSNQTAGICNTVQGSPSLGSNEVEYSDYGYIVAQWSVYLFLIAFGVGALMHIVIGAWRKHYWVIFTLGLGAAIEAVGWGGRLMSYQGVKWNENLGGFYEYDHNSFIIQIVTLVIAPTLFSAANYIILGKLINATGGRYSILTPRSFAILFMFGDFVCLVVQGAGGGIAGTAITAEGADQGAYIMTGGVILQLVITVAFFILLIDFVRRYRSGKSAQRQFHPLPNISFMKRVDPPLPTSDSTGSHVLMSQLRSNSNEHPLAVNSGENTPKPQQGSFGEQGGYFARDVMISKRNVSLIVGMLFFTTLLIVIRSLYRSVELTDGWSGPIAVNQALFLGCDAILMALLVLVYIIHPAFFLPHQKL